MARTDRFYIGMIESGTGLDTSLKPYAIPDNAFQMLVNMYVFRGRVRKRFGSKLMNDNATEGVEQLYSRVRMVLDTTNGSGNVTTSVPTEGSPAAPVTTPAVGQLFSIDDEIFTVYQDGFTYSTTNSTEGTTDSNGDASGTVTGGTGIIGQSFIIGSQRFVVTLANGALTTSGTGSGTFNTATGAYTFTGCEPDTDILWFTSVLNYDFTTGAVVVTNAAHDADVIFYPATAIVGIVNYYDGLLNNEPFIAFDQNYAYEYNGSEFIRLDAEAQTGASVWHSENYQVMWGSTYRGILNSNYYVFVSNFNITDRMRYYNVTNWNFYSPVLNGTDRLLTARIVVPFKDRLVCLNTVEAAEGSEETTSNGTTGNFTFNIASYEFTWDQTVICGTTTYTIVDAGGGLYTVDIINNAVGPNPPTITATFVVAAGTGTFTSSGDTFNLGLPVYYLPNDASNQLLYVNRCRFSQNGSPVAANAFQDNVAGLGGYIDAPVKEQIITAEFLKDRLIVYFESSTWELVYTGNEILPFRWQQINTELGAQSTFSIVPFDKVAIGIGNTGVHACNGTNVERIDNKIPDYVFQISNDNDGVLRVYGIRDYYTEMIYWSLPTPDRDDIFPNRVLVYNYKNGSWAINQDSITAFGYYNDEASETWASSESEWQEYDGTWFSSSALTQFRAIIAGNQEGFVFMLDTDESATRNSPALQITDITYSGSVVTITCVNHNLQTVASDNDDGNGDYIIIENCQGITDLNDKIYAVGTYIDENSFTITLDPGDPSQGIDPETISGVYTGGGTIARVSNINIQTKQFNFYANEGRNAAINKIDFFIDSTQNGQVTVDYAMSSSRFNTLYNARQLGSLVGTGVLKTSPYSLIPLEATQDRLWHPIYPMANGESIQLEIYMADNKNRSLSQIRNTDIAFSEFVIHAFVISATRTSDRFQ